MVVSATAAVVVGLVLIIGGIYLLSIEQVKAASKNAGSKTKRVAASKPGQGMIGAAAGMQIGYEILRAGITDPYALVTLAVGIFGALGIEGFLGDISGMQYLGIVGLVLLLAAIFLGSDDDEVDDD